MWDRRGDVVELYDDEAARAGTGVDYFLAEFASLLPAELPPSRLRALVAQQQYAELERAIKQITPASDAAWIHIHDRASALGCLFLWGLLRSDPAPPPAA